jgi:uncharacterized protein YunC (DUF1805 family)
LNRLTREFEPFSAVLEPVPRVRSSQGQTDGWSTDALHRWEEHLDLKLPLLIIRGSRGVLACCYLNVETLNKTGEVGAIVTDVKTFEDMLNARAASVPTAAAQAGIRGGVSGAEVVERIR